MKRPKHVLSRAVVPLSAALLVMVPLGATQAFAQAGDSPEPIYRGVGTAARFDVSPPLRSITIVPPRPSAPREIPERASGVGPLGPQDVDPLVQGEVGPNLIPAPILSFNGQANVNAVSPPDPIGDVGPSHYVAMSNLSFTIYDKAGTLLFGPAANNTLWAGFGGDCETDNAGDPVVVYDQLDDRWILTQFTSSGPTFFNCVAVSTTGDPTGTYFRYAFGTGTNFPDYPKYGVWPDALYISTREFSAAGPFAGVGAYAIDRVALIAGNPSPLVISFLVPPGATPYRVGDGLLPTDMDGSIPPPVGTPNFFVGSMDNGAQYGAPQDALTLWKFHADFASPASSTFTLTNTLPVAPFDSVYPCTPAGSRSCIPQPGTTNKIDILSYRQRPTWRLAYRNFGTHESLVTNQSVEAAANIAGIRWYEIRDPNGAVNIFQQGTYAPGVVDGIHRWMGSIAMDSAGNMALGYSASNATTFPGVRYTGRLEGDPLGTMPQGEQTIVNGTGSQTGSQRWGDYSSMNVDPVDDCTFWYVNEWVPVSSGSGWRLRIGSFKFPSCGTPPVPDFSISCSPSTLTAQQGQSANSTCTVTSTTGFNSAVTLDCTGLPSGASCNYTPNPVTPPANGSVNSSLTVSVLGGVPPGTYPFQARGTSGATSHTFNMTLNVTPVGGAELLVNGGFEGSCNPWRLLNTGVFCNQGGAFPHSGTGYTRSGGQNNHRGSISQEVSIPASAPANLTFWLSVRSDETTTTLQNDRLFVEVRDPAPEGAVLSTVAIFSNLNKGTLGTYSQKGAFSLAAFRGMTVRLQFRVANNASLPTTFLVDDVSLQ